MSPIHFFAFALLFSPALVAAAEPSSRITILQPLSQQFRPVARVKQAFSWTFASTTFESTSDLTYTAFDLPAWLSFSGSNRSFTGYPDDGDVGEYQVEIKATSSDGQQTVSDSVNLAVTTRPGPIQVTDSIASQLQTNNSTITSAYPYPANSTYYPGVRVPPNWSFSLGFQPFTYTAASRVFYAAHQADGSPLPPWMTFNNQTVTFDGITPQMSPDLLTIYDIIVSGSDTFGYSDAQQQFKVVIAAHDFQLIAPVTLNLTAGDAVDQELDVLSSFTLDGELLRQSQIGSFHLDNQDQSWLAYNDKNRSINGQAPSTSSGSEPTTMPLSLTDKHGDIINTTLAIQFFPSIFTNDHPEPSIAAPGTPFDISLSQFLSNASTNAINLTSTLNPSRAGSWLSLYTNNNTLGGVVPLDVDYDSVSISLKAQDLVTNAWSHTDLMLSLAPNGTTNVNHGHHLHRGTIIALASLGGLTGLFVLLCLVIMFKRRRSAGYVDPKVEDEEGGKWAYANQSPTLEEKMETPLDQPRKDSDGTMINTLPHLSSGSSTKGKKGFSLAFGKKKGSNRSPLKISNPTVQPSFSNAAFQAQLAAAVDSAGIIKRGNTYDHSASDLSNSEATNTLSLGDGDGSGGHSVRTVTDDSQFNGHSSRASWESEPPFVWTNGKAKDTDEFGNSATTSEETHSSSTSSNDTPDPNIPVQRSDFRPSPPQVSSSQMENTPSEEDISIDNIHFPTDSDIAHTESESSSDVAIITTASRIDARRTLDSPTITASPASSHTEKAPSPVMTTHSRLVSFGKQKVVQVNDGSRSTSQTAVVVSRSNDSSSFISGTSEVSTPSSGPSPPRPIRPDESITRSRSPTPPASLPSLPALPTMPSATSSYIARVPMASAQRVLLGVGEAFHFYPPLNISPSPSQSSSNPSSAPSSKPTSVPGASYHAYVERKKGGNDVLDGLPEWLHFDEMELWGVPGDEDRGTWDVRVVEVFEGIAGKGERIVGRFALEVVGR